MISLVFFSFFFFFNDTATTEIYTLSLHDALPISGRGRAAGRRGRAPDTRGRVGRRARARSEEHTSELQSLTNLVCRLLLEKKKKKTIRASKKANTCSRDALRMNAECTATSANLAE